MQLIHQRFKILFIAFLLVLSYLNPVLAESTSSNPVIDSDPTTESAETQSTAVETENEDVAEPTSFIVTDDANSEVDVTNEVNINTTEIITSTSTPTTTPETQLDSIDNSTDSSTDETTEEVIEEDLPDAVCNCQSNSDSDVVPDFEDDTAPECGCTEVTVTNDNQTEIENGIDNTTNTGNNLIDTSTTTDDEFITDEDNDSESEATTTPEDLIDTSTTTEDAIITGDINSVTNLVNLVNTNLVGVNWQSIFSNIFSDVEGDIDLSSYLLGPTSESIDLNVINNNQAEVNNNINVNASSGNNVIQTKSATSIIDTGDVKIAVNLINIINTNIIGSNWLIANINIFGDFIGDLILPSHESLDDFLYNSCVDTDCPENLEVVNENEASVDNEISINANTGNNEILTVDDGGSVIDTGDVTVSTNVQNFINQNTVGSNWLFANVNVLGAWHGQVYSLPNFAEIQQATHGVTVFGTDNQPGVTSTTTASSTVGNLIVNNNNSADVTNNIDINANSGSNTITGDKDGLIKTGSVEVVANLLNFINTNFVGSNFVIANVNVFGSWDGNLAFGQPDLALTITTSPEHGTGVDDKFTIDDEITYTLHWVNNGTTQAHNVVLYDHYDADDSVLVDAGTGTADEIGVIHWDLGDIPVGASGSVSYTVKVPVQGSLIGTDYLITDLALITSNEADANMDDNSASVSLPLYVHFSGVDPYDDGDHDYDDGDKYFSINKINNVDGQAEPGSTVTYTITVQNISSGDIYDVYIFDTLRDPAGNILTDQQWPLDTLHANETVTIDYTINYAPEAEIGLYINTAEVNGYLAGTNALVGLGIENHLLISTDNSSGSGDEDPSTDDNEEGDISSGSGGDDIIPTEPIEPPTPATPPTPVVPAVTTKLTQPSAPKLPNLAPDNFGLQMSAFDDEPPADGQVAGASTEATCGIPWLYILFTILAYFILIAGYYWYFVKKGINPKFLPILATLIDVIVIIYFLRCWLFHWFK